MHRWFNAKRSPCLNQKMANGLTVEPKAFRNQPLKISQFYYSLRKTKMSLCRTPHSKMCIRSICECY